MERVTRMNQVFRSEVEYVNRLNIGKQQLVLIEGVSIIIFLLLFFFFFEFIIVYLLIWNNDCFFRKIKRMKMS